KFLNRFCRFLFYSHWPSLVFLRKSRNLIRRSIKLFLQKPSSSVSQPAFTNGPRVRPGLARARFCSPRFLPTTLISGRRGRVPLFSFIPADTQAQLLMEGRNRVPMG